MNAVSAPQPSTRTAPRRLRFSLQTLFFLSFLLVSPFVAAAFASPNFQTTEAASAPIFLVIGAAIVGIATAVGYSLGNRRGAFVGTLTTGGLWLGLALLVLLSDDTTFAAFLLHGIGAVGSTTAICVWLGRQTEDEKPSADSATFARLRSVKQAALQEHTPHEDEKPH